MGTLLRVSKYQAQDMSVEQVPEKMIKSLQRLIYLVDEQNPEMIRKRIVESLQRVSGLVAKLQFIS